MNKELLRMVELVALEKGLPQDAIIDCLEKAMAGVCRKNLEDGARVRVSLAEGEFQAWREWVVVADDARLDDPAYQVRQMDSYEMGAWDAEPGDHIEEPMEMPTLSRVAARSLYQQLIGNVRQAERELARQAWESRVGEMAYGTVKRVLPGRVILDVEGTEASLDRAHQIAGERLKVGARVVLVIRGLNEDGRGAPLLADRRGDALLEQLLAREVPEIQNGMVRVRSVARDGRGRAKVAVESVHSSVDAVAACVGMRGVRIQAVARDLAEERIHLMEWSDNPVDLAVHAIAPVKVIRAVVDENSQTIDMAVGKEDMGRACGRGNTNPMLVSKLTGWQVNIMSEQSLALKQIEEAANAEMALIQALELDDTLAQALVTEGFMDVESVAFCDRQELLLIEGVDEALAEELQARARTCAMARAVDEPEDTDPLWMALEAPLRQALALAGVVGSQALAECAVDEIEGVGGLDAKRAGEIILEARKPWLAQLAQGQ